jgi:excisionase family DNA binding protein
MRDPNFRQPFDQLNPPKSVTDPQGPARAPQYPKPLYKAEGGVPDFRVVTTPAEEAAAIADGWCTSQAEALDQAAATEAQERREAEETRDQRNKGIEGLFDAPPEQPGEATGRHPDTEIAPTGEPRRSFFSVKQAAKHYGVSKTTIRRKITDGKLPAAKVGRALRIHGSDLVAAFPRRHPSRT